MTYDCDAVVIGAGISGLVTAFQLARSGRQVRLLESATRPGGVIGTREHEGALYELGPNSTLDTTPLIASLLAQLDIAGERIDASAIATRRFIVRDGAPVVLPTSPGAFLRSKAFSTRAKLRLLREPFIAPAPRDVEESIASFTRRRLGQEFLDYAVDPFVAGVYAGNPEEISVAAAFPRLHALEQSYGSLIKGQIRGRRERERNAETARNAARTFSFRRGMETLPRALGDALPGALFGATATRIALLDAAGGSPGGYQVHFTRRDANQNLRTPCVVCSVPAYAAAPLADGIEPALANALRAIEYAPVASLAALYRSDQVRHALDGFGFLVPRVEHRRILGTLFSSSMFPGRAPEGHALLTTFAGGRRNPGIAALADDEIEAVVAEELAALLGAPRRPVWQQITRWQQAIPQYTLGHADRMRVIDDVEARRAGLFFCASYRGGVSVGDCIRSAHALATRADAHLGR